MSPRPVLPSFGRVRFPLSSGSRFEPLIQLGTQEVVPTTVVDAVDEVNQAIEEDQVLSTVAQSDTETVPSVRGSCEDSDDGGHSPAPLHPRRPLETLPPETPNDG